jgi:hypothetical protein
LEALPSDTHENVAAIRMRFRTGIPPDPAARLAEPWRLYERRHCSSEWERYRDTYPFCVDPSLSSYCVAPLVFSDGVRAGLALYRQDPFTEPERELVEGAAEMIPNLFRAMRDRVSLALIGEVALIVQMAEQKSGVEPHVFSEMRSSIQDICHRVGETFGCWETSIYLENVVDERGVHRLAASTLESCMVKPSYLADPQEGLTGWVLHYGRPIRISDLGGLSDNKAAKSKWPDLVWHDPMHLQASARKWLALPEAAEAPPISYMAVPILSGEKVLGAIRCLLSRRAPFYFAERELSLLKLIAAQVGLFWNNWLARQRIDRENQLWRKVVEQVSIANQRVQA